ncbi:MAG: hypothetical protein NTV01_02040, partial [Bacteroidia bacterium]|nr:hypothetical protein [Bacteroidia bacterium]
EGVNEIQQLDPVRFGKKKIWLSANGSGEISSVEINGKKWTSFDKKSVFLPYDQLPETVSISILFGNAINDHLIGSPSGTQTVVTLGFLQSVKDTSAGFEDLRKRIIRQFDIYNHLIKSGLGDSYEAAHARLAFEAFAAAFNRRKLTEEGKLQPLPRRSQEAVDLLYLKTAETLCTGIENATSSSK